MIVEMKKAYRRRDGKKRSMLKALGKAGLLHLKAGPSQMRRRSDQKRSDTLSAVISLVTELHGKKEKREQQKLSPEACAEVADRWRTWQRKKRPRRRSRPPHC